MNEALLMQAMSRIQQLETEVARLVRQQRSHIAVSRATLPALDTESVQRSQGRLDALSLRDRMPTLHSYGFSSSLPVGGDKVVAFMGADRSQGIVIATGHQSYRFTGLVEGESVVHDMWGRFMHMAVGGIVIEGGSVPITIRSTAKVRFETPRLECTGDIIDQCDTQPHTQANFRSIYDTHTHHVHNVQPGGSTIDTDIPIQPD